MKRDSANVQPQAALTKATSKRRENGRTVTLGLAYLAEHPVGWLTIVGVARAINGCRWTLQRSPEFKAAWQIRQQSQVKGSARCPLTKLAESYIAHRPGLKSSSAEQIECSVKAFDRFLERSGDISDLTEETLTRFISSRLLIRSQSTVKRERVNLVVLWRFAARKKLIPSPPVEGIPAVKIARRSAVAWTVGEITRILATCDTLEGRLRSESDRQRRRWVQSAYTGPLRAKWWASLILFLYDSGARIGATLQITPADIDLGRGLVTLRSDSAKTGLEQVLRLSPQTVAAIRDIYDGQAKQVWQWLGAREMLYAALGKILDKAGLPKDRSRKFHCFRRTCATLTAVAGRRDLSQSTLGHTTPTMTSRYIDARALPIQSAADVLPRPQWSGDAPATTMPPETPSVAVADALKELTPDALEALLRLAKSLAAAGKTPA